MDMPLASSDTNNEHPPPTFPEPQQFWSRLEELVAADHAKVDLLKQAITSYDHLLRTALNYKEEIESAQAAVAEAGSWRDQALEMQTLLDQTAFVAVLIDGNSLLFHPTFLSQGAIGGEHVATLLHTVVTERIIPAISECPAHAKIVARVYVDLTTLATRCAKAGFIATPSQLQQFMHGFMQAKVLFDVIDVGPVEDRATLRVIEQFKILIGDFHCRQVVLGFDGGSAFLRLLDYCSSNTRAGSRLTLVDGAGPAREGLRSVAFPGIFHLARQADQTSRTHGRTDSRATLNGASGIFTPAGSNTPVSGYSPPSNATVASPGMRLVDGLSPLPPAMPRSATTWASITTKNAHKPLTTAGPPPRSVTPTPMLISPKEILRNKKGQRLDAHMSYDREEVQRIKKLKSCNQHYIGVGCCHYNAGKQDKCPHNHHYNFTAQDLKALRVVARETPCKSGHECDNPKCIYGHQCPFPVPTEGSMRGTGCMNGDLCRFPRSMHDMDNTPARMTKVVGTF